MEPNEKISTQKAKAKIKFKKLGYVETLLTLVILGGISTILYLYTSGYRLNKNEESGVIDINKTGMISVKSIPDGASVYLDGKLKTATDDTIPGLTPGIHNIRIVKKGFLEWSKDIEVYEQLVTDITAVLVSQSTRLDPLTNTGAKHPSISPTLSKLAYFSFDSEKPGIWVIPLTGAGLGLFRTNPTIAIEDTRYTTYSNGEEIIWSPDEKTLLIRSPGNIYYLINLDNNSAQTTLRAEEVQAQWKETLKTKRETFIKNTLTEVPQEIIDLALSDQATWAPDEKKFLFTRQYGDQLEYRVYNFELPLPIGEKTETLVFTTNIKDPQPKVSWYTDSFHLILVEGNIENENRGTISLIRIDGSNKTEIYNNTLHSDVAFSSPGGDKVVILTSFKSSGQTDLYTVSIR